MNKILNARNLEQNFNSNCEQTKLYLQENLVKIKKIGILRIYFQKKIIKKIISNGGKMRFFTNFVKFD